MYFRTLSLLFLTQVLVALASPLGGKQNVRHRIPYTHLHKVAVTDEEGLKKLATETNPKNGWMEPPTKAVTREDPMIPESDVVMNPGTTEQSKGAAMVDRNVFLLEHGMSITCFVAMKTIQGENSVSSLGEDKITVTWMEDLIELCGRYFQMTTGAEGAMESDSDTDTYQPTTETPEATTTMAVTTTESPEPEAELPEPDIIEENSEESDVEELLTDLLRQFY